jgi:hypothetical protein
MNTAVEFPGWAGVLVYIGFLIAVFGRSLLVGRWLVPRG